MSWDHEKYYDADHLWPRHQPLGRNPRRPPRLIGAYEIGEDHDFTLLEFFVERRWPRLHLEDWHPYRPRGWAAYGIALADFYLSEDGQELVGSFLHPPPNDPVTRFVLLLHWSEWQGQIVARDKLLSVSKTTWIPERLLRLIWLEW